MNELNSRIIEIVIGKHISEIPPKKGKIMIKRWNFEKYS